MHVQNDETRGGFLSKRIKYFENLEHINTAIRLSDGSNNILGFLYKNHSHNTSTTPIQTTSWVIAKHYLLENDF